MMIILDNLISLGLGYRVAWLSASMIFSRSSCTSNTRCDCTCIRFNFVMEVDKSTKFTTPRANQKSVTSGATVPALISEFKNNYFAEMSSGSRGGLVLKAHRLVYHSTLGLRVIKKKKRIEC